MYSNVARLFTIFAFGWISSAHAANFTVDNAGSQPDQNPADNICDFDTSSGGAQCTLRAAMQQANAITGPHTIVFASAITQINASADLPTLIAPTNIDGTNASNAGSGGRVVFNGNNLGCFSLAETGTMQNPNGARGSTLQNLVIRNCQGNGVSLSGHGYSILNNRIGTNAGGSASDFNLDANEGDGISLSGTVTPPNSLPNIQSLINNPALDFAAIQAFQTALQTALTVIANPTFITGNLVSGNKGDGIELFTPSTVNVIIAGNIVGTNQAATVSVPNGRGTGNGAGIRFASGAYGNFVGPGNIISGNNEDDTDDGLVLGSGAVLLPNFVSGNLVGVGSTPVTDVGNGDVGVFVDTRPDTDGIGADNPTGFSLFLGPANTISDNRSNAGGAPLDQVSGDVSAGVLITGASSNTRVFGNFIGLFQFPAGGSPIGSIDTGNAGNGIVITTSNHQIGGSQAFEANFILRNARHGILFRGSGISNVTVRGNFIGVAPPTGLSVFDFGNAGDGIYNRSASSLIIGGTGSFDDNVIAGNGRNGISLRDGNPSNGWSNLIQRNQIYGNDRNSADAFTGIGIDLDRIENAPDPIPDLLDPDPNQSYANFGQNQPSICTGASGEPPACAGATPPSFGGSSTSLQWTLTGARPNSSYRIEFFSTTATSQTYLDQRIVTSNGAGVISGAGCVAGLCTASVGGSTNTQGSQIQLTATDLFPTDVPPIGTGPGNAPSNNTSEFSAAVGVPQPGELRFSAPTYSVTEAGPVATITVQRVNGSNGTVGVTYATSNGSANAGLDYTSTTGSLAWADADAAPKTFDVPIAEDTIDEPNETVNLTLSAATGNATIGTPGAAVLTITDNDPIPTIAIADVSLSEGNSGTTAFGFSVTLSNPSSQTVTVNFASANGSATTPGDYAAASGTLTFVPGDVSETATVNVVGDAVDEPTETFVVNLTTPANATIADPQATGTIVNDDSAAPVFSISDFTLNEGNAGTTAFSFTVTRSPTTGAVSVQAATSDGTATAGSDYVAVALTTLNFAAGIGTQNVTVNVNGDTTFEPNETVNVNLSNPTGGATIGDGLGVGTITNDDTAPTIAIADVSLAEGNSGTTAFGFAVTLSNPSSQTVTVNFATANGTATTPSDYAAASGTLTFVPGDVSETATVNVVGDAVDEPTETFVVNLTAPTNATIADPQATGTIVNDDSAAPVFSISDFTLNEGNAGTTAFSFSVTRMPTTGAVSVQAATSNGTATAGSDYVAVALTTLNFADGIGTQNVTVNVNGDTTFEPNETFNVNLSNPTGGATIGDGLGVGTINNDDTAPTIAIADVSLSEGNAGTTAFGFVVTLSNPSAQTVTVNFATDNGTATTPGDYAVASGTLTFVPGDVSETASVNVVGDAVDEPTEAFVVNLTAPTNATIADPQATGTIVNDDSAAPMFSISDVTLNEGNAGTTAFSFTVTRAPTTGAVSVQAASSDGTATAASDYLALALTTLNFADGIGTQNVTVNVNGDTTFEPNETFNVNLSNPTGGATIGDGLGVGTITNDDTAPTIAIADVSLSEGNVGTTAFGFAVTLSNPSSQTVTVNFASANGTATTPADYAAASGTLTFVPGDVSETATVNVVGDAVDEPTETFVVNLTAPANATIADPQATGTIVNDDVAAAVFSINDVTLNEGNSGTTAFSFTVTRTPTTGAVSVQAATSDGTATAGSDYNALALTTLNFAAAVGTQTFTVNVNGDTTFEPNETFNVNLSNPTGGATIGDGLGIGTITNDDTAPTIAINDVSLSEGNSGTTLFGFVVSLSNPSSQTVAVNFATANGTATAPGDYATTTGTLSFVPGDISETATVNVFGDTVFEPTESFAVDLSAATNASIADAQGIGTISNDDAAPIPVPAGTPAGWLLLMLLMTSLAFAWTRSPRGG